MLSRQMCLWLRGPRAAELNVSGMRLLSTSTSSLFGGRVPGTDARVDWDAIPEVPEAPLAPSSELASAGLGGYSPVGRNLV